MTVPPQPATIRSMMLPAFVPQGLFSVGLGAITPVIPLSATELGSSVASAAAITALVGIGQLLADAPAGSLTARFGERTMMVGAAIVAGAALAAAAWAPNLLALAVAVLAIGAANAVWILARITFVADRIPAHLRARAMSSLGGSQRIGFFVGPFIGAAAITIAGTPGAYLVGVAAAAAAAVVVLTATEPGRPATGPRRMTTHPPRHGYLTLLKTQRRTFATVGTGIVLLNVVRASRQTVLPLWGEHLGFDAAMVSVIFGTSIAIEIVLFYPAGRLMDLRGRGAVAVLSTLGLAVTHLLLPLSTTTTVFILVAVAMGVGNGIGSGLVMTLGADVAPPDNRPVFFGLWRLIADIGNGAGPFLLAAVTAITSLTGGILAMGGVGFLAAAALGRWAPNRPGR